MLHASVTVLSPEAALLFGSPVEIVVNGYHVEPTGPDVWDVYPVGWEDMPRRVRLTVPQLAYATAAEVAAFLATHATAHA